MCDIYDAKCPKCGGLTDMHLADFSTGQKEVAVFCHKCIPASRKRGCLWLDDDKKKVFVRALTENARQNADGNHPNAGHAVLLESFGKKMGIMKKAPKRPRPRAETVMFL